MPVQHTVQQGECLASLGVRYGFTPDTLWGHPDNAPLRDKADDAKILKPGDTVVIPDLRPNQASGGTGSKHRFRRKGVPEKMRLVLRDMEGEARADVPWKVTIDGEELAEGTTGSDGAIELDIPPDAQRGKVALGKEGTEVYDLELGSTDPIAEVSGVQQRLRNLGYSCGPIDGVLGDKTRAALRAFQTAQKLDVSGEPDDRTRQALVDAHQS